MDKEDKNNNYIPQDDENQNNPYYNPYFQNTNLNNSPYFDDNNINFNTNLFDLNNDNNSIENNTITNNNTNVENNANLSENTNSLQYFNENIDSTINNINPPENNQYNTEENNNTDNIDLFNLDESEDTFSNNINTNNNTTNTVANSQVVNPILQNANYNFSTNINNEPNSNINNEPASNINNEPASNINNEFNNSTENNIDYYGSENDEEFRKTWMRSLYSKAQRRKFSIPAFFFGGLYFLFRKLYLVGLIILLITMLLPVLIIAPLFNENFNISTMLSSSGLISIGSLLLNILYGFIFYPLYKKHVENKLKKYKNEVQNPNQLIDIAVHKGGISILAPILVWLGFGLLCGIIFSLLLMPIMNIKPEAPNNNNLINNEIAENPSTEKQLFNFYKDYNLEYDSSKWFLNSGDNSLVNGNYKLSYIQSLEDLSSFGYDLTTETGRANFFTFLYSQFSSQIDTNTTLELGSSNFSKVNNIYFAYLDLVYATSIERCYFILIPEEDTFIELVLSNADTVISDEIHEEVYEYISNLQVNNSETQNNNNNNMVNENVLNNSNVTSNNINQPSEITLY